MLSNVFCASTVEQYLHGYFSFVLETAKNAVCGFLRGGFGMIETTTGSRPVLYDFTWDLVTRKTDRQMLPLWPRTA